MKSTNVNGTKPIACVLLLVFLQMYKKLRTFRFCAAIMSPGCPPPAVPAVCCPQYPPLPAVLCPSRPAALRLRYPPSVACGSRRLLPFLLRGLMPSAWGTRCQPVACDCRPPVTRGACCPLSSAACRAPLGVPVVRPLPAVPVSARCPARYAVFRGSVDAPPSEKKAAPDRDGSARVQYARSLISWRLSCPLRRAR